MKISDWLAEATSVLKATGISTARLDCLILLEDILAKDRAFLLAHPEFEISKTQQQKLNKQVEQRQSHTPLAYIRGKIEFYGRDFFANKDVLVPRPESETMIELLLANIPTKDSLIIDIGTGSGALAVTAKLELSFAKVMASDIDPRCLAIASINIKKYDLDIKLISGNLLEPFSHYDHSNIIILANLPYVPDSHKINQAAAMEPRTAIFGGPDGLDLYRQLFNQASRMVCKPTFILTESLPPQHDNLTKIARELGYKFIDAADFIQVFELAG